MIEKIISTSRTTEVHGSSRLIITSYSQAELPSDPVVTGIITQLTTATDELGAAIKRSKAQSILAEKDDIRDERVRAIGYQVQGYTYHPDEAIRNAAAVVKSVFDKYGFSVIKESYVSESSHIVSMLGDFAKPPVQAAIALLSGVTDNIAALQAAETDFENTSAEYAEELAEEDTQASASVLKKQVVTIINDDLVVFLRTARRFQAEIYGAFAATVAEIIAKNNEQVKKRQKKSDNEDE
uniref:DUF6261 family protein n=1 Tax=uncultured Draconibacterium sp. TaxID=1573823 RepID=UPI0032169F8D